MLEAGWRRLYPGGVGGKKEKEPPVLPPVSVGQEWPVAKIAVKEGETKPPPRYSEAALLGAMETAGKFVEDEELRQAMKDSGLGTPATRAATIERLLKVGYLEREKKVLVPTERPGPDRAPRREPARLPGVDRPLGGAACGHGTRRREALRLYGRHRRVHAIPGRGGARQGRRKGGHPSKTRR